MSNPVIRYITNVLIGFDQLGTTLIGGYPDETLSSYAYRMHLQKKLVRIYAVKIINFVFFWQKNHCANAYRQERMRYQLPPILRGY